MGKTRQRLISLFTVIGIVSTCLMVVLATAVTCTCISRDRVPRRTVLEIHFDRALGSPGAEDPLSVVLGGQRTTWLQLVDALHRGAHDDRVLGAVAYIDGTSHGMAHVEELRDAVLAFRASGKPAVVFAETFGELGPGNQGYYLATAFDEILLQPSGALGLSGLRSEKMFLRGLFDKLDVEPHGDRRAEYKTAYDHYAERRMSAASREQTESLLADMEGRLVTAIAPRLGDDEARARRVLAEGPYLAPKALDLGLVDRLVYRDQALDRIQELVEHDAERLYPGPYLERAKSTWSDGEVVAVISGSGAIMRGPSAFDPIGGSGTMGAETIVAAFRAAIDDPDVEAIVFRVDSPGGSAVASDAIWHATQRAREAGKPVVVSMGNYAASGGYYVSAGANKIVAQPSTVTGSIGVVVVKQVTRGLWNKVGITWDQVQTSRNASFWSTLERYDEEGWKQLQHWLDATYADFKQRVADGRGMSLDQVEQLARGRVWTGAQAHELGLVDALGGLPTAIALAKQEAGIDEDATIELRSFPRRKGLLARALEDAPDNSDIVTARTRVETGLERWQAVAARLEAAAMASGEAGVLVTAPLHIE